MKNRIWIGLAVAWTMASASIAGAHPPPLPTEPDPYLVDYPFVTTEDEGLAISDALDGSQPSSRFTVEDSAYLGFVCTQYCFAQEEIEFVGADSHLSHMDGYTGQVTLAWNHYETIGFYDEEPEAWVNLRLQVYCDTFYTDSIPLDGSQGHQTFPVSFAMSAAEGASGNGSSNETGSAPADDCETQIWGHDISLTLEIISAYDWDPTLGLFPGELNVDFLTDGSSFLTVRSLPPSTPDEDPVDDPTPPTNGTSGGNGTVGDNETVPDGDDGSGGGNQTDDDSGDTNETASPEASGEDEVPTLPGASAGLAIAGILGTLMARRRNRQG